MLFRPCLWYHQLPVKSLEIRTILTFGFRHQKGGAPLGFWVKRVEIVCLK